MGSTEGPNILSRASIVPPPGMQMDNRPRVEVYLASTEAGKYRWFREDGTPTVVAGNSVENASRAAGFAWKAWDLQIEETGASKT